MPDAREGASSLTSGWFGAACSGLGCRDVPVTAPGTPQILMLDVVFPWLSAFHAARHRVWKTRFRRLAGIVMVSPGCRDIDKFGTVQSTRRTGPNPTLASSAATLQNAYILCGNLR